MIIITTTIINKTDILDSYSIFSPLPLSLLIFIFVFAPPPLTMTNNIMYNQRCWEVPEQERCDVGINCALGRYAICTAARVACEPEIR